MWNAAFGSHDRSVARPETLHPRVATAAIVLLRNEFVLCEVRAAAMMGDLRSYCVARARVHQLFVPGKRCRVA